MQVQANEKTFRSYVAFWLGQLISLLGSSVAQFVIVWWITLETGSALYLSLAVFIGFAPAVIISPFAGVFVDRWSRKILIATADFLQALATVVLILLFSLGLVSILPVFLVLALRGVLQAFHSPAVAATIPLMVPREKLSRMNGLNFLFSGAVTLVGPVAAAMLLELWPIGQVLWVDAVTFIVAVIPLLAITIPSAREGQDKNPGKNSFKKEFGEGLAFIRNTRGLLPFAMVATMVNFLLTPISTLMPYFVKFEHFGGAPELALVMAFFQGGILAGGVLMSLIKGFKRKMLAVAFSVYIVFLGYAFMAFTPTGHFWFMAISGLIMALCIPVANVSIQTILQTIIPPKVYGRISSVLGALSSAAAPLGMILSGLIVGFTGTPILFFACSVSGMLIITLSWFFTNMRNLEVNTLQNTEAELSE
jgi:DHA3 family macrolide efflux protein-like MFS transporter